MQGYQCWTTLLFSCNFLHFSPMIDPCFLDPTSFFLLALFKMDHVLQGLPDKGCREVKFYCPNTSENVFFFFPSLTLDGLTAYRTVGWRSLPLSFKIFSLSLSPKFHEDVHWYKFYSIPLFQALGCLLMWKSVSFSFSHLFYIYFFILWFLLRIPIKNSYCSHFLIFSLLFFISVFLFYFQEYFSNLSLDFSIKCFINVVIFF